MVITDKLVVSLRRGGASFLRRGAVAPPSPPLAPPLLLRTTKLILITSTIKSHIYSYEVNRMLSDIEREAWVYTALGGFELAYEEGLIANYSLSIGLRKYRSINRK